MTQRGPRVTAISVSVGAAALILGYIGYRNLPQDLRPGDALYRSIQLFFLDYHGPNSGGPWQLEAARFLAAAVSLITVLAVVSALLRDPLQRLRIRAWAAPHVVVFGLGDRGMRIVKRLQGQARLAVVERNAANGQILPLRSQRVPVIVGDARNEATLQAVRLDRTSDALIVAGDDTASLEILAACHRHFAGERRVSRTMLHVAIDDLALWHELHRLSLERGNPGPRTEFLSIPDRVAERLVSTAGSMRPAGPGDDSVLIYGRGAVAVRVAVHAVRRSLLIGGHPTLILAGPDAESIRVELDALEGWVFEAAEVSVIGERSLRVAQQPPPASAFVCGLVEAEAVAIGAELGHQLEAQTHVFVDVPDEDIRQALVETRYELPYLHLIAAEASVLGRQLLEDAALVLIARAKHADYVIRERHRGLTAAENPSMVPWDELPESLRQSNYRFAESVGSKLAELGASLEPLDGALPQNGLPLSREQLESLAVAEHDRWIRDLEEDGWTYGSGEKDPVRKRHPLLVSWDDLDEASREKDREAIRAIPKVLAGVGYQLSFSDQRVPGP